MHRALPTLTSTTTSPSSPSQRTTTSASTSSLPTLRPDVKAKLVVVGDGGVGKTCLLVSYAEDRFPEDYVPTVFENYVTRVTHDSKLVEFALWDTAGQEEYDRLRPLSYPETDVLLICFSIDYPPSLENVLDKWYPETSHFLEGVPLLLVGTKTDLRTNARALELLAAQGRRPVSEEEGREVARRMGAGYVEVCAKEGRGVGECFAKALEMALKGRGKGLGRGRGRGRGRGTGKRCRVL